MPTQMFPLQKQQNTESGLTKAEVKLRYEAGKYNKPIESPSKTVKQIILSNIFTYFNLIFLIIAIALIFVGKFSDLTFMIVIIINTLIGTFQEINSKKALDRLSVLNQPTATVLRDGAFYKIPTNKLVIDDIIQLSSGQQVCADAKVISGEVSVNEALVTGESDEITKLENDDLLSGSFIVSGKCLARLTAVGKDSFVSKLTLDAKKMKKQQKAGMMVSLTRLIQVIGVLIIPVTIFLLRNARMEGYSWGDSISSTAGAILGMIPEGLYLLTSIALAVSVIRLTKQNTLVHDLGCIETLARVDVICVDKTGTITEPKMQVTDSICITSIFNSEQLEKALSDFVSNMEPENDTMIALRNKYAKDNYPKADKVIGFSSRYKYSGATIGGSSYVIGAPEFILSTKYEQYKNLIDAQTLDGSRVLLFASYNGIPTGDTLVPQQVNPLGLVKLLNPVRKNAPETFRYFTKQGVQVKVISGDTPATASKAAIAAEIPNASNYIDLSTLETDKEVYDAANQYTVFGRVTPERKKILVNAIKDAGHVVAMTGDGVNDVLALKEADCSIAMASGSDVAAQISNLVLLNSDFSALPSIVNEGRRVINNIERSASLFLVKNIFSFIFALITIFANITYPITPASLTLVNTVTIGIPSFLLTLEPNFLPITGKFMTNVLYRAMPAGLTDIIILVGVSLFKSAFNLTDSESSTMCIILIAAIGITMLFFVCKPFNPLRVAIMIGMPLLFILGATTFPSFFKVFPMTFGSWLILVVLMLLSVPIMLSIRWIFERGRRLIRTIKERHNMRFPQLPPPSSEV